MTIMFCTAREKKRSAHLASMLETGMQPPPNHEVGAWQARGGESTFLVYRKGQSCSRLQTTAPGAASSMASKEATSSATLSNKFQGWRIPRGKEKTETGAGEASARCATAGTKIDNPILEKSEGAFERRPATKKKS